MEKPFVDHLGTSWSTRVSPGVLVGSHPSGAGAATGGLAAAHAFLVSGARGLRGREARGGTDTTKGGFRWMVHDGKSHSNG